MAVLVQIAAGRARTSGAEGPGAVAGAWSVRRFIAKQRSFVMPYRECGTGGNRPTASLGRFFLLDVKKAWHGRLPAEELRLPIA